MPLAYSKNKIHIYNWVANNKEKSKAIVSKYQKRRYAYEKQTKIFRNILFEVGGFAPLRPPFL